MRSPPPNPQSAKEDYSQIIDAAFLRPDALETYLEAGAPEEEVIGLRKAISSMVMEEDDQGRRALPQITA